MTFPDGGFRGTVRFKWKDGSREEPSRQGTGDVPTSAAAKGPGRSDKRGRQEAWPRRGTPKRRKPWRLATAHRRNVGSIIPQLSSGDKNPTISDGWIFRTGDFEGRFDSSGRAAPAKSRPAKGPGAFRQARPPRDGGFPKSATTKRSGAERAPRKPKAVAAGHGSSAKRGSHHTTVVKWSQKPNDFS